ncbi:putative pheromone precursor lipoprotein [Lachnospiraceae bacterium KM106-2]|nr:putative pheromone precursor lipoprotein [Lachnospiraceae bacterium KM106-2]
MKMNLKSLFTMVLVGMLSLALLTGCSSKDDSAKLKDGTYTKTADKADDKGFTYEMKMVVKDGKITSLDYDATSEAGKSKKQMSLDGEYTMTTDGLTWAAQSEALAKYVMEHNSVKDLTVNDEGKTDVVSGVSINIQGFLSFASDLLKEATK